QFHHGVQPRDAHVIRGARDGDGIVPVRTVHDYGVGLAIAAATRDRQVQIDQSHVGCRQVADVDRVRAAERGEVYRLNLIDVHRHISDVAEEAQPTAVR